MLFVFVVLPIFLVTIFTGVDTWLMRGILLGAVAVAFLWAQVAALILAVGIIIAVAFTNSLHGVTGSSV